MVVKGSMVTAQWEQIVMDVSLMGNILVETTIVINKQGEVDRIIARPSAYVRNITIKLEELI